MTRHFQRLLACAFFGVTLLGMAGQRPDVLMIAVDDLRPMLGCYGDPRAKTPNMDRLAALGVVFERAYCQYAKCGVSRLSLMSGLRPDSIDSFGGHHRRYVDAYRKRRPDATPMGQWFKQQGYHTRGLGKIYHDGWDLPANWSKPTYPGREKEMLEYTMRRIRMVHRSLRIVGSVPSRKVRTCRTNISSPVA